MKLGLPVLTSDAGSLREVVGDAALLIDPRKPRQLADAMGELASSERLRAELRARGFERAKDFSFDSELALLAEMFVKIKPSWASGFDAGFLSGGPKVESGREPKPRMFIATAEGYCEPLFLVSLVHRLANNGAPVNNEVDFVVTEGQAVTGGIVGIEGSNPPSAKCINSYRGKEPKQATFKSVLIQKRRFLNRFREYGDTFFPRFGHRPPRRNPGFESR